MVGGGIALCIRLRTLNRKKPPTIIQFSAMLEATPLELSTDYLN